jgi:D-alanine transfer protein
VKPIPDKAALFFRRYPTDFEVCPVGKAGSTSLILLQKFAAVGSAMRGRKVAISISPSWFFSAEPHVRYYEGNFSVLQADELVFGSELSPELKRAATLRVLDYPQTTRRSALLDFAARHLVGNSLADRALYLAALPLGRLETALLRAQDDFQTVLFIHAQHRLRAEPHRRPQALDWDAMLARASRQDAEPESPPDDDEIDARAERKLGTVLFLKILAEAREWTDLELLLRELRELGAEPLLLTMPANPRYLQHLGVSRSARESYLTRLHALADRYSMPLVDFQEHEDDPNFLAGMHDHLSAEGWMFYNKALDDFYHRRPISL